MTLRFAVMASGARFSSAAASVAVDLIEDAVIGEVGPLRLLPAAEGLVHGKERDLREAPAELRRDSRVTGAVVMPRGDLLPLGRVEVLEVGLGDGAGLPLVHHAVHDA